MVIKWLDHFKTLNLFFSFLAVTNFNNGLEASSDSDDEDKLHIVEEDSLQEPEVTDADGTTSLDSHDHDATVTVLPHNGSWNGGEARAMRNVCLAQQQVLFRVFSHLQCLVSLNQTLVRTKTTASRPFGGCGGGCRCSGSLIM